MATFAQMITRGGVAFSSFGTVSNASVVAGVARLKSISCSNVSGALVYLQIFNLATAPVEDTSVPIFSWSVPAGTATQPAIRSIDSDELGLDGYHLGTGLAWGISVSPSVWDSTGITASNHVVNGTRV